MCGGAVSLTRIDYKIFLTKLWNNDSGESTTSNPLDESSDGYPLDILNKCLRH